MRIEFGNSPVDLKTMLSAAPTYSNRQYFEKTNERKFVIRKGSPWPKRLPTGTYAYCVLPDGEVRISEFPRPTSDISHPELVGEREVIGAGMIEVEEGTVTCIDNQSGHYEPDVDSITYSLMAFRYWNIPLSGDLNIDASWSLLRR